MESVAQDWQCPSTANLSDALDALGIRGRVARQGLLPLVPGWRLSGPAYPMQAAVDHPTPSGSEGLIAAIDAIPAGAVALIEAAGVECAMFGELTAIGAVNRRAAGVVCNGFIRDVEVLRSGKLPVFARGFTAVRSFGRADIRTHGGAIQFAGVAVDPGDFVVADVNGIVIVPREAKEAVLERAAKIAAKECELRAALARGGTLAAAIG